MVLMNVNVLHDGKSYPKNSVCPKDLAEEFVAKGLARGVVTPKEKADQDAKPSAPSDLSKEPTREQAIADQQKPVGAQVNSNQKTVK